MFVKYIKILSLLLLLAGISVGTASCSSKEKQNDEPLISSAEGPRKVMPINKDDEGVEHVDLKQAFFDYDKAVLRAEGKAALRYDAEWLKKHPDAIFQIEGHCDERGTPDYNMKLGEKRAAAARRYLIALGVPASRLTMVSYGADPGTTPNVMAKNRRAGFVVVYSK